MASATCQTRASCCDGNVGLGERTFGPLTTQVNFLPVRYQEYTTLSNYYKKNTHGKQRVRLFFLLFEGFLFVSLSYFIGCKCDFVEGQNILS